MYLYLSVRTDRAGTGPLCCSISANTASRSVSAPPSPSRGRHDRPFPPKRPVLGLIRPTSLAGMRKKFDVDAYIAMVERLTGDSVPGEAGGPAKTPARQERLLPRR